MRIKAVVINDVKNLDLPYLNINVCRIEDYSKLLPCNGVKKRLKYLV